MFNKWIGMGRLTADPELKQTTSGISVCKFTVAVDRKYKGKDSEKQTDFINITAWRGTAEFVSKYFTKGKMIVIEGTLQNNNYEKDGVKHYSYEVLAEVVTFGESKSAEGQASATASTQQTTQAAVNTNDEAIGDLSDYEAILSDEEPPF